MPCYHPIKAYRDNSGTLFFHSKSGTNCFKLPCGQCVGCRLERSRQWAVRCMHEASLHDDNCFITLTYEDDITSLDYRHFQLFMKRLRKFACVPVRFYMCGEYGEKFDRPHFHACLFGYNFADRVPLRQLGMSKYFRSDSLDRIWSHGFATIGDVTFESAAYVARYVMKKINGDLAEDHYCYIDPDTGEIIDRVPEFCHMSLKPGIGAGWFDRFSNDVVKFDTVVSGINECLPPKYYDKLLRRMDRARYDFNKYVRVQDSLERYKDSTDARLIVREQVTAARVRSLKRKI